MADQHDRKTAQGEDGSETAVIPKVQWPTVEPDETRDLTQELDSDRTAVLPVIKADSDVAAPAKPAPANAPPAEVAPTKAMPQAAARPAPPPKPAPPPPPFRAEAPPRFQQPAPTEMVTQPVPTAPPAAAGAGNGSDQTGKRPPWRRIGLVTAAALGVLGLLYGMDLLLSRGELPRGVTVAGVSVGGMNRAAAEQELHREIEPRLVRPVPVRAGDVDAEIDPEKAGLRLDWPATLDSAGSQPLNPWTRLTSLFSSREVGVVTQVDPEALGEQVDELSASANHEPVEGTIRFEGTTPVAVEPQPGQTIDREPAIAALTAHWADGTTVELPVTTRPVNTTLAGVNEALETVAKPAVSGPVAVNGEGGNAKLTPEAIVTALTFEPGANGGLNPKIDNAKVVEALQPQLAKTETPGKDATVALEGGVPVVKPSVDGLVVDWEKSLGGLLDVLKRTDDRKIDATYMHQPAKFTTEQAGKLGIKEVVGEFTTRGFARDSGVNIRMIASEVNGALVKPGETFSLNGYTGARGLGQGYIEAGIIESGRPGRAVGGGCSQFATTLYNAAYFAGMADVEHQEHSYYISRYPEAREATVFQTPSGGSVIDVKFRNDSPSGILIETIWTPTDITVRMWSTKHYAVESQTGARSDFTNPQTMTIPPGEPCTATTGAQGFRVSNTRIVRDAATGRELRRNTRNVTYKPLPIVVCATEPLPPPPPG